MRNRAEKYSQSRWTLCSYSLCSSWCHVIWLTHLSYIPRGIMWQTLKITEVLLTVVLTSMALKFHVPSYLLKLYNEKGYNVSWLLWKEIIKTWLYKQSIDINLVYIHMYLVLQRMVGRDKRALLYLLAGCAIMKLPSQELDNYIERNNYVSDRDWGTILPVCMENISSGNKNFRSDWERERKGILMNIKEP